MKKIKSLILCITLLALSVVGYTACGKKNQLTFEVPASFTAEVGNYFNLPEGIGQDTNGDIYTPVIVATDPNGDDVIIEDGRIFIDYIGEYSVEYTVTFNGNNVSKTTVITSVDTTEPIVSLDSVTEYEIVGGEYQIPVPEYEDNYDAKNDIDLDTTVTFNDNEVTITDGKITLSNLGEYKIKYVATDTSNNVCEKTLTVNTFEGENDNIGYFNKAFGADKISLREDVGSVASVQDRVLPGEEYSLKFSVGSTASNLDNARGIGGLFLNKPYVTDITVYDYLYFYVYTDTEDVGVTFNGVFSSHRLNANAWNKVVLTKTTFGEDIDYVTPWGTRVFYDDYSQSWVGRPTDITDLLIWLYVPETTGANVWFSSIRGTNELPVSSVEFASVYGLETIDVPTATVEGIDGETQKVYVTLNGETNEITESTVTFTQAGSYLFSYHLFVDGKLIDIIEKTVMVVEEEAGNLTYFNYSFGKDNVSHDGMGGVSAITEEKALPAEASVLKHVNTSYWGVSHIVIDNAYKKDITEYKYLYFYVMVNKEESGVTFNDIYSGDRSLVPNVWNRIVLTRNSDATNYTTPWGTDVFSTNGVTPTDMSGFKFIIYHPQNESTIIYLSSMRGTNVDPLYASVEFPSLVMKDETFDIPTATVEGATEVSQKVYHVSGTTATEITTDTYSIGQDGVHIIAFEVYADGKYVETIKKSLVICEREEGNITYFNQSFGTALIGSLNGLTAGTNTQYVIEGESSSMEFYLQAPGYWPAFRITSPFITNLNAKDESDNYLYNYVYFFAYTESSGTSVSVHGAGAKSLLPAGVWTRIIIERSGDTFLYNGINVFGVDSLTANDITGLQIVFDTSKEVNYTSVYLSTFRAVKEIPELTVDTSSLNFAGDEIDITPSVTDGYTAKGYIDGSEIDFTEKFIPENDGVYTVTYKVTKNGILYDIVNVDILVTSVEADNLSYFNKDFATKSATVWSTDTTVSATQEKVYCDEEYSLKVSAPTPYWGVAGAYLTSYIKDITSYNYVYFYVYTETTGLKFFNTNTGATGGIINADVWNKVVLTKQQDGSYTSPSGLTITASQAQDMTTGEPNTHFGVCAYATGGPNAGTFNAVTVYVSAIRVSNELSIAENVVVNMSSSLGTSNLDNANALSFGKTGAVKYQDDECSTEFYLQAIGWPTIKIASPTITNLNVKGDNDEYLYDYVYFYAKSGLSKTRLMIGNAYIDGYLATDGWTKVVLERVGETFVLNGADVFANQGTITANDITGLQILFDTSAETAWTSVYMSSWMAVKTL